MRYSNQHGAMGTASLIVIAMSSVFLVSVSLVSVHTLVAPAACLLERMLLS